MSSLQSDILVLDSKGKNTGTTNQSATYNLVAMGGIGAAPLARYELLSFHAVNQVYTVETGVNDLLYFIDAGGLITATLDPGTYTPATMFTEVVNQMGISGDGYAVGSVHDTTTGKYTIVRDGGATFQFLFAANTTASARRLLGMDEFDDVLAISHTSDYPVDLKNHGNIIIRIPEEGRKDVSILDGSDYSFLIPLNSDFGEHIHHRKEVHYQQLIEFVSNVSVINVDLYTGDGVALVNSPDYELVLRRLL